MGEEFSLNLQEGIAAPRRAGTESLERDQVLRPGNLAGTVTEDSRQVLGGPPKAKSVRDPTPQGE
jgi:hypothetical protein